MNLIEQWKKKFEEFSNEKEQNEFWSKYLEVEKSAYQKILQDNMNVVEGNLSEVAAVFGMQPVTFSGFIDGLNTSLQTMVEIDDLTEESQIKLEIDFEKLFWNMHEAKADWLYNLEEWDNILSLERRLEIRKDFNISKTAVSNKIGRNEPCPCGSGKKYKKCCAIAT